MLSHHFTGTVIRYCMTLSVLPCVPFFYDNKPQFHAYIFSKISKAYDFYVIYFLGGLKSTA